MLGWILCIIIAWFVLWIGLFIGRGYWAWVLGFGAPLAYWGYQTEFSSLPFIIIAAIFLFFAFLLGIRPLRRNIISRPLMGIMRKVLPRIGETERIALEAGDVWWDADLFSGKPDWKKLLNFSAPDQAQKEKDFLAGPCEKLCEMLDAWEISQRRDLPPEIWDFIKKEKFFGMIIPEEYGGLGFGARGHADVVTKITSRSLTAAVTVMVPNSLGPAELILHYGTEEQKKYFLPRLAVGEEIPCFALTGPEAGSDAAAMQSTGVVCEGTYEGKQVLGIRLNWNKRYITLGPVATIIGLAFRMLDPEHLLGDKENLGITCALIPHNLPGIDIGKRHDPLGIPFQVGPNWGKDVFVPLDFIIGGREQAGQGWRMLMQSLAAGRSISLPSVAVAGVQMATRVVGAYATIREQFDTPIGRFEGIEEPLARIGGLTYAMNCTRQLTLGALDAGHKPSVISAIVKAYLTDRMRQVVNDAMDIRAGAGICEGPRNVLARVFNSIPIGITVEGANILTRSMIIYGQGAIRCHPFVQDEMESVATGNLKQFDRAFFGHANFVFRNSIRSVVLAKTGSRLSCSPVSGPLAPYFRHLSRMSAAFAFASDVAMGTLGGTLKRREKITGRLADCLAWMYIASAVLKTNLDNKQPPESKPLAHWACQHALYQIQQALLGVIRNLPNRIAAFKLKVLIFPFGAHFKPPNDRLGSQVARSLLEDREARRRLTRDIYIPKPEEPGIGKMEAALDKAVIAIKVETKIRDAVRTEKLDRAPGKFLLDNALEKGIISAEEHQQVLDAKEAQNEVIQVDYFDPEEFRNLRS